MYMGKWKKTSEQQVLLFNLKFYFEINENATIKFKCFLILKSKEKVKSFLKKIPDT